jgi:hypothetical protein
LTALFDRPFDLGGLEHVEAQPPVPRDRLPPKERQPALPGRLAARQGGGRGRQAGRLHPRVVLLAPRPEALAQEVQHRLHLRPPNATRCFCVIYVVVVMMICVIFPPRSARTGSRAPPAPAPPIDDLLLLYNDYYYYILLLYNDVRGKSSTACTCAPECDLLLCIVLYNDIASRYRKLSGIMYCNVYNL